MASPLVVNWFGDSLDGTLTVGNGIGLSPFLEIEVALALALVIVYLMLSVNVYLESSVFHKFKMAYGKIGPTEGRILLIAGNVALVGASAWGMFANDLGPVGNERDCARAGHGHVCRACDPGRQKLAPTCRSRAASGVGAAEGRAGCSRSMMEKSYRLTARRY